MTHEHLIKNKYLDLLAILLEYIEPTVCHTLRLMILPCYSFVHCTISSTSYCHSEHVLLSIAHLIGSTALCRVFYCSPYWFTWFVQNILLPTVVAHQHCKEHTMFCTLLLTYLIYLCQSKHTLSCTTLLT